jgi:hypothetical protein
MPISDKKKCYALINAIVTEVERLQTTATRLKSLRTAYVAQGVDPTGTPLDGHVPSVSNWIDDIDTVANNAIVQGFIAHRTRYTHIGDLMWPIH